MLEVRPHGGGIGAVSLLLLLVVGLAGSRGDVVSSASVGGRCRQAVHRDGCFRALDEGPQLPSSSCEY